MIYILVYQILWCVTQAIDTIDINNGLLIILEGTKKSESGITVYELNCSSTLQPLDNDAEFIVNSNTVEHLSVDGEKCLNSKGNECSVNLYNNCYCIPNQHFFMFHFEDYNNVGKTFTCQMRFNDPVNGNIIKGYVSVLFNGTKTEVYEYSLKIDGKRNENGNNSVDKSKRPGNLEVWISFAVVLCLIFALCIGTIMLIVLKQQLEQHRIRSLKSIENPTNDYGSGNSLKFDDNSDESCRNNAIETTHEELTQQNTKRLHKRLEKTVHRRSDRANDIANEICRVSEDITVTSTLIPYDIKLMTYYPTEEKEKQDKSGTLCPNRQHIDLYKAKYDANTDELANFITDFLDKHEVIDSDFRHYSKNKQDEKDKFIDHTNEIKKTSKMSMISKQLDWHSGDIVLHSPGDIHRIQNGYQACIEKDHASEDELSPFITSRLREELECATFRLSQCADINMIVAEGQTASDLACHRNQIYDMEYLIDQGCDIHKKDKRCWTPLKAASCSGNKKNCTTLISKGAVIDIEGWTPLLSASEQGYIETVKFHTL